LTQSPVRFRMSRMKQCPECGAQYNDSINFCRKDGRSLIAKVSAPMRLCPHCANSIAEDAERCPYCKAVLGPVSIPQWPHRDEPPVVEQSEPVEQRPRKASHSRAAKGLFLAAVVLCAMGLFFVGANLFGRNDRGPLQAVLETKIKEVEERDQKIQSLEAKLAEVRQGSGDNSKESTDNPTELTGLRTKLQQTQKELAQTQQRLERANRELSETASERSALRARLDQTQKELAAVQVRLDIAMREVNRSGARSAGSNPAPQRGESASAPQRPAESAQAPQRPAESAPQRPPESAQAPQRPAESAPQRPAESAPPVPARRAAQPGTYQTIRSTDVHEEASASSPVIARVGRGTTLTVIRSVGDWLEVRSKHGKPPGFIRRDDAMYVNTAN
jgi:hypothetical protein